MNQVSSSPSAATPSPLKVALLEPRMVGHHPSYLRWIAEALLEAGHKVTIATDGTQLLHPELAALSYARHSGLTIIGLDFPPNLVNIPRTAIAVLHRELMYRSLLSRWFAELNTTAQFDTVFLPYVDYSTYGIALAGSPFGQTPWGGIVMRPTFHLSAMGVKAPRKRGDGLRSILFRRLLRCDRLIGVLATDPLLCTYQASATAPIEPLYEPVAPVNADRSKARQRLGLSVDLNTQLILVYGAISARKGVREILEAIARDSANVAVLLAGTFDEPSRKMLGEDWVQTLVASGRLLVQDRYHDASEELDLFAACDTVWLGYLGHYTSSGVLALAGSASKPVIACDAGLIGYRTEALKMGITVDPTNIDEVCAAVHTLQQNPSMATELGRNGHLLFASCTYERAKSSIVRLVEGARSEGRRSKPRLT